MKPDSKFKFLKKKTPTTLLGLTLDGGKLEGVVLRRVNGALQKLQSFSAPLALDPLTAAPELVGREIRNQLDAAGVRERNCVVGVPLKWILTAHTELPPLPEADAQSLLAMEAERSFSSDVTTLQIGDSRCALATDKKFVLFAGLANTQAAALENALLAAKLKPLSFALGIAALQSVLPASRRQDDPTAKGGSSGGTPEARFDGVLTLNIGENSVGLQITAGGGIAALRALEGAIENEGGRRTLHADIVARETRITLGQLPEELRVAVKRIRIFGPRDLAQTLADEMELRFEPLGLKTEMVSAYAPAEFGATLPVESSVSPAFSLAARAVLEQRPVFEFLPPKPSAVEQFLTKYSSGRLGLTGMISAGVAVIVIGLFLFQQFELWSLRSQWSHMEKQVTDLQGVEANIQQYRPWYGGTYPNLAILRQLTLAFPEDGSVTAKTIEIQNGNTVNCSGTARDYAALLQMQASLRAATGVSDVKISQTRGKTPIQFSFGFQYGGNNAN